MNLQGNIMKTFLTTLVVGCFFSAVSYAGEISLSGSGTMELNGTGTVAIEGGSAPAYRALLEGDETNGAPLAYGTGTVTKVNAANITFTEASQGVGFDLDGATDDIVSVGVANINPDKFRITFKFGKTDQTHDNYGKFFCLGAEQIQFMTLVSSLDLQIDYNGVTIWKNITTTTSLFIGVHDVEVNLDNATDTVSVYIDNVLITNEVSATWPGNIATPGSLFLGNRSTGDRSAGGRMADITIYDTLRGE